MIIVYAYWGCVTADGERKDVRIMMDLLLKGIVLLVFILLAIVVLSTICFIGSCVAENMREEREKSPENQRMKAMVDDYFDTMRRIERENAER